MFSQYVEISKLFFQDGSRVNLSVVSKHKIPDYTQRNSKHLNAMLGEMQSYFSISFQRWQQ